MLVMRRSCGGLSASGLDDVNERIRSVVTVSARATVLCCPVRFRPFVPPPLGLHLSFALKTLLCAHEDLGVKLCTSRRAALRKQSIGGHLRCFHMWYFRPSLETWRWFISAVADIVSHWLHVHTGSATNVRQGPGELRRA